MKLVNDTIICAFVILITFWVYFQVVEHDFINFDDLSYITENQVVQKGITPQSLKWAFVSFDPYWHPVTWISHMVDCHLFGLDAGWHHLSNLIYHLINCMLVFVFFRMFTGNIWASGFIACVFALHPLNVESVAWAAERKNVLSTTFWMMTLITYSHYARSQNLKNYLVVIFIFCLGLMAKPMLVTIPFILLLLDYWPLKRIQLSDLDMGIQERLIFGLPKKQIKKLVIEKIPFIILSIFSVFLTSLSVEDQHTDISTDLVPVNLRLANAFVSYVKYIVKLFWPANLAVYYPFPQKISTVDVFLCVLVIIGISILVLINYRKRPYLVTGWFWYLGGLVPVIGLKQAGLWPSMADRWGYVPLIGIYVMVAWGILEWVNKKSYEKTVLFLIPLTVCIIMVPITYKQTSYWKNSETLFLRAIDVTERNETAYNNLGAYLLEKNDFEQSILNFKKALQVNFHSEDAHFNLATAFEKTGEWEKSLYHYKMAIELSPDYYKAYNSLGVFWGRRNQFDKAVYNFSKALEYNSKYGDAYNNLGLVYEKTGQLDDAIKNYKKAISVKPDFIKPYQNLGYLYGQYGEKDLAMEYYGKALYLDPSNSDIHNSMGVLDAQEGNYQSALNHFSIAIKSNPEFKAAKDNYERILIQLKNKSKNH